MHSNGDAVNKYISGSVTSMANTLVFYPIEILRVRYFLKKKEHKIHKSLFNGLGFTVWSGCIKGIATYPAQEIIRDKFSANGYNANESQVYSSMVSGCLLGIVANPINTIKVPMQARTSKVSAINIMKEVYGHHGLKGFYRGGSGIIMRDMVWASTYFPLYKIINDKLDSRLISSLIAGGVSMTTAYPFDGMRLYRQHHPKETHALWHGFQESFKLTRTNIRSYAIGMIRTPLSVTFSHMLYLKVCDLLA